MAYWNENLHKKAYLLEFSKGADKTSYVFSLPPQSEDFQHPQRVAETKTFGGSVYEDYGNDTVNITLTGTTANNSLRLITKNNVSRVMTGEEAVFDLQKTIESYGKFEKLDGKEVVLYSQDAKDCKYWRIVIKEFNIKRSKDNPMAYTYTLSATGKPTAKGKESYRAVFNTRNNMQNSKSFIDNLRDTVSSACESISKGTKCLKDGLGVYRKGLDLIDALDESVEKVTKSLLEYVNLASRYIDSTTEYITESFGLGDNIISASARITLGAGLTLFNDVAEMNSAAHEIYEYCLNFPENNIYVEMIERYGLVAKDIKSKWIEISSETEFQAASAKAIVMNYSNVIGVCVLPGDTNSDDQIIVNYGYKQKVVTESDTWDSLANTYYQNPELGSLIALYNGLDNNNDKLVVGKTIRIPIISKTESNRGGNEIYTDPDNTDNYGTDVLIDNSGDLAVSNEDFQTISGTQNLGQAINSRLQTGLGARVQLVAYGIREYIGSSSLVGNYITASIRETLLADPRVKTVDRITYQGNGDKVYINVIYTDINNVEQTYGGTI